jgi:hypothetical protein
MRLAKAEFKRLLLPPMPVDGADGAPLFPNNPGFMAWAGGVYERIAVPPLIMFPADKPDDAVSGEPLALINAITAAGLLDGTVVPGITGAEGAEGGLVTAFCEAVRAGEVGAAVAYGEGAEVPEGAEGVVAVGVAVAVGEGF